MNIDAHLAKAITKFANKKKRNLDNKDIPPFYLTRLEKDIARTAVNGQNSINYSSNNDLEFYKFLLSIKYKLKKEGFKFKYKYETAPCGAIIVIITISWK